jgi:chromosome segregation ATPase
LFKQSLPADQSQEFNANPLLFKEEVANDEFQEKDWANAPRVEYASALYRKLAPPRTARVVDDSSGFKLETYGAKVEEASREAEQVPTNNKPQLDQSSIEEFEVSKSEYTEKHDLLNQAESSNELKLDTAKFQFENNENNLENLDEFQSFSEDEVQVKEENNEEYFSSSKPPSELIEESDKNHPENLQFKNKNELNSVDINDALIEEVADSKTQMATDELESELSELKSQLDKKNNEWEEERSSLNKKLAEMQELIQIKEKEYTEQIQSLETNISDKISAQVEVLKEVTNRVEEFTKSPERLFEPIKRLSMHIAEQLVLAELNLSGSSIERLIQRCLDELSNRSEPSIIVELNIQDKDRLEELSGEVSGHVQLRAVPGLQVGSVRVISDDTQVDDLITNRLEGMAHSLLGQPEIWREKSPFFRQPLAQRDSDVQDVKQRITASDDSFVENFND